MAKDAQASLRFSSELKRAAEKIASDEHRTLSSVLELLLIRGYEAYRADGLIISSERKQTRKARPDSEEELANRMADKISERLLRMIQAYEEARQPNSKKHNRAA